MAEPTRYTPGFNYSGWEADHPTEPKPGAELDNDFALIRHSIDETIRVLRDVRRSDGKIQNAAVDFDALSPAVKAAIAKSDFDYEVIDDLLAKDANLQDIPDKAEARENLEVPGRGEVVYRVSNLLDLANLKEARANLGTFSTAEDVQNSHVPAVLESIRTFGRNAPGDGPPLDLVRGSEVPGAVQSADGRWWEDVGYNTITVRIPSQFPTLQAAVDHYSRLSMRQGALIDLVIEAGHQPEVGLVVQDGDFCHFRVSSEDEEVLVSANWDPNSRAFITGQNARIPILNCLVNGNGGALSRGYEVQNNSTGFVMPGCGVKNAWTDGLSVKFGAVCYAPNTIWTGNAVNGSTSSGIGVQGGICWAEGADVSDSHYYGAQASSGGILIMKDGTANNTGRYGFRARDSGMIDAFRAEANGNVVNGVYAFNNGFINFRNGTATGNGQANVIASRASVVCATDSILDNGVMYGVNAAAGSLVDVDNASITGCGDSGIRATASIVSAFGAIITGNARGIEALRAGIVHATSANVSNNITNGISASTGGKVAAPSAAIKGNGGSGVFCDGGEVDVTDADCRENVVRGIYALRGGRIVAPNTQARKDPNSDTGGAQADITCLTGGLIHAEGAIGGTNKVPNQINADGIIFRTPT